MKRKNPRRERARIIRNIYPVIAKELNLSPRAARFFAKQQAHGIISRRNKAA